MTFLPVTHSAFHDVRGFVPGRTSRRHRKTRHDRGGKSLRRGGRARNAAPRRFGGGCRHRRANGFDSGRAGILRESAAAPSCCFGTRSTERSRASTGAKRRRLRRRPACFWIRTASRANISMPSPAGCRLAYRACSPCWTWRIGNTANCPGRNCSRPAIALAEKGVPVGHKLAATLRAYPQMRDDARYQTHVHQTGRQLAQRRRPPARSRACRHFARHRQGRRQSILFGRYCTRHRRRKCATRRSIPAA